MKHLSAIVSLIFLSVLLSPQLSAQTRQDRPKIVVGVVVDQMRWDYLHRYEDRYSEGGFKRLFRQGFACENTHINYGYTATAPGHTCVYTGSVPAVHGIVENSWYDRSIKRAVNCVEDTLVQKVGAPHSGYSRSPENLLVTTIGDELKLSNNMRSKVLGISIKDRGAIIPAGHLSDGSYWYDPGTGKFITSTYFMEELPGWMNAFNDRKLAQQHTSETWEPLYPLETYIQSTADDKPYEGTMIGKDKAIFPYDFSRRKEDYGALRNSIYGNSMLFELARAAMEGEKLGEGEFTDMLTISFSATDGLGHKLGPNAVEIEDMYLRLDLGFAALFDYLDERYGENGYLFFITADHGASQSVGFLEENGLPTGVFDLRVLKDLNVAIERKYGIAEVIESQQNAELYLNWENIRARKDRVDEGKIVKEVLDFMRRQPGIAHAELLRELPGAAWPEVMKERYLNDYHPGRSGDIVLIPQPGWQNSAKGTDHGTWYPFDSHIPLVWMGWKIPQGVTHRTIGMTDIAPTISALLKIQMPSGSIGEPILEITDRH